MSCQHHLVKVYIGYTQEKKWLVLMTTFGDCECPTESCIFYMFKKNIKTWQEEWKTCQDKIARNKPIQWDMQNWNTLWEEESSKTLIGKILL